MEDSLRYGLNGFTNNNSKFLHKVFRFQSEVFSYPAEYFELLVRRNPWFKPEDIVPLFSAGKLVSCLQIFPKPVRIGNRSIMMGGVGNVATLPRYRRRGYATMALKRAIQLMRERGYGLSVLFTGMPDFYRRLKWEVASPHYEYSIATTELCDEVPHVPDEFSPQTMRDEDLPAVLRAYETTNRGRTLSVVRSLECWRRQLKYGGKDGSCFLVIKKHQNPLGYSRCIKSKKGLEVVEAGFLSDSTDARLACEGLLAHMGRYASGMGLGKISANVPPDHLLARHLLAHGAVDRSRASGNLMARIVDFRGLMESLLPELSNRVSNAGFSGRFSIQTEEDGISLEIKGGEARLTSSRGGVNMYRTSHRVLAQHMTGHLLPLEAFKEGLVQADPSIVKIVDLLFRSDVTPHMWKPDRF
ncbi:MAG: enhanced intracellular survival protein Eis [Candidatus Bathyarchaeia archaeon]